MCLHELVARLVIQQPCYLSLILNRIERWARNKDMAALDEIAKFLVKQREQEALDVQAVDIRVSGNDNAVELQASDIKRIAGPSP